MGRKKGEGRGVRVVRRSSEPESLGSFPKSETQAYLSVSRPGLLPGFLYTFALNWTSLVAQLVKNLPTTQETLVQFLG